MEKHLLPDVPLTPTHTIPDTFRVAHRRLSALDSRSGHEDPADPGSVQAMQIALLIPKNPRPPRTPLLEAAAQSVVACCLDPRAGEDTEFSRALGNWYDHRIRKVARRARGVQWERAQTLPGVTATVGECSARAYPPGAVSEVPQELKKLQIGGTELDRDEPGPPPADIPVIWIDGGLEMTVGKAAAQVGHASMLLAKELSVEKAWTWAETGYALAVREVSTAEFTAIMSRAVVSVRDAGFTEVRPGSVTVCATMPN